MSSFIFFVSLFALAASWQASVSSVGGMLSQGREQDQAHKVLMRSAKQYKPEAMQASSFDAFDSNHDGNLDRKEFAAMQGASKASSSGASNTAKPSNPAVGMMGTPIGKRFADLFSGVRFLDTHGRRAKLANNLVNRRSTGPQCTKVWLPNVMGVPAASQYTLPAIKTLANNFAICVNRSTDKPHCEDDHRCQWIDIPSRTNDVFPNCIVRDVEGIEYNLTGCGGLEDLLACETDNVCEYKSADREVDRCNSTHCELRTRTDCVNQTRTECNVRDGNYQNVSKIQDDMSRAQNNGRTEDECRMDSFRQCNRNVTESDNTVRKEMDWDCVINETTKMGEVCTASMVFDCIFGPASGDEATCNTFSHCAWSEEKRCEGHEECKQVTDSGTGQTHNHCEWKEQVVTEGKCEPTFDAIVPVISAENDAGQWVWDAWACSWACTPFTTKAACPASHCKWVPECHATDESANIGKVCCFASVPEATPAPAGLLADPEEKAALSEAVDVPPPCPEPGCVFPGPKMAAPTDGTLPSPYNGGVDTGNQPQTDVTPAPTPSTTLNTTTDSHAPSLSSPHWIIATLLMIAIAQLQ